MPLAYCKKKFNKQGGQKGVIGKFSYLFLLSFHRQRILLVENPNAGRKYGEKNLCGQGVIIDIYIKKM